MKHMILFLIFLLLLVQPANAKKKGSDGDMKNRAKSTKKNGLSVKSSKNTSKSIRMGMTKKSDKTGMNTDKKKATSKSEKKKTMKSDRKKRSKSDKKQCVPIDELGVINLDFNPAYLRVEEFEDDAEVSLFISSFYNNAINDGPGPPHIPFERDLVARIPNIDKVDAGKNYDAVVVEELTDLPPSTQHSNVWPNEPIKAPEGVFPFEALVIPQGFLSTPIPGRLTVIDMDDPVHKEYIIHQSAVNNARYYHDLVFCDIDGDGLDDIITVRSGFNPLLGDFKPIGELVWFKNPGYENILAGKEWPETIIYGLFAPPLQAFQLGPDIEIEAYDFDGDGVPEFVATNFWTEKISIFGSHCTDTGCSWAGINAFNTSPGAPQPRITDISIDQGRPLGIEIVDLNGNGKVDILATNHARSLNCLGQDGSPDVDPVDGRVYVLEQPSSGDVFGENWTTHVLLDGIRPHATIYPGAVACRMAPGHANTVSPCSKDKCKPWIVVSGDEAAKVWILKPTGSNDTSNWDYESEVIFDINDFYGEGTTQTVMTDPNGISISTIGKVSTRKPSDNAVNLYIPVFEGMDIHVLRATDCDNK